MKRFFVSLLSAILAFQLLADRQEFQEKFLTATGGKITKPGSQQGSIIIANAQSDAKLDWIEDAAQYLKDTTHYEVIVRTQEFDMQKAKVAGAVVIFIIDNDKMPTVLCAPEDFWGVINVSKLKSEKTAFYQARVKKEISRIFALLCGAASSRYTGTLLHPITKAQDLDSHVDNRLPADIIARIPPYLGEIGIKPSLVMTYIAACKQGWAPSPTNSYQKAIWNEVHSIPTKPLTIEPEKAPAKK